MSTRLIEAKECPALRDAREDFKREPDAQSAGALLEAAFDAWNDEDLDERDFASEVMSVRRYLARVATSQARGVRRSGAPW